MKNLATPFHRLVAWKIDALVTGILPIYCVYKAFSLTSISNLLDNLVYFIISVMFVQILFGFLNSWLTAKLGGSLGKLLTGIQVVNSNGTHLSFKKSLFRNYVGYLISGSFLALGFFWVFKDKNRQTWHDQLLDTYVTVKNPSGLVIGLISLIGLASVVLFLVISSFWFIHQNKNFYQESLQDVVADFSKSLKPSPKITPTPSLSVPDKVSATVESDLISDVAQTIKADSSISQTQIPWQNSDGSVSKTSGFLISIPVDSTPQIVNYFIKNGFTKFNNAKSTTEQIWLKNNSVCILSQSNPSQNWLACSPKPQTK